MWKYELKSILYNKKIWLYTIIAIAVNILLLINSVTLRCELFNQENYDLYNEYVSDYGGYITDDKISAIDLKINEFSSIINHKDEMQKEYDNSKVTFATYYESIIKANSCTKDLRVLNYIKEQINYVTHNKGLTTVIYPNSWVHLLAGMRTRYSLIILIIFISIPIMTRDFESNMDIVTSTCKNGKMRLYINKVCALSIFAFLECVLFGITEYMYYFIKMGLQDYLVNIRSIEAFKNVLFDVPLIGAYIMQVAQWFVGMVLLILITMLVSLILKKSFFTYIFMIIYSIFPSLIFNKSSLLKMVCPVAFVTDGGYLFGVDEYDAELLIYKMEELVMIVILTAMIATFCLLISKIIIERKKNKNVLKFVSMITVLLGFGVLSGCGMNYKLDDTIYVKNTFLGYEDMICDKYVIEYDEESMQTYINFDDKKMYLYDNAISRIYTDDVIVSDCMNIDDKIYYTVSFDDGEFDIYQVDMNTLDNKRIYTDYTETDSYLNYKRTLDKNMKFMIELQLVTGNLLVYTDAEHKIYLYNLDTKKEETFEDTGTVIGVKNKKLYYINDVSELIEYDFATTTKKKVFDEHIVQYVFWKDSIIYIDLSDLKLKEYDGYNIKIIEDKETDVVFINNDELVWYVDSNIRKTMK